MDTKYNVYEKLTAAQLDRILNADVVKTFDGVKGEYRIVAMGVTKDMLDTFKSKRYHVVAR